MIAELIKRLEEAPVGSREMDWRISEAIAQDRSLAAKFERAARRPVPDEGRPLGVPDDVPPYTTSLDAALTLVPEGWYGSVAIPYPSADRTWLKNINTPLLEVSTRGHTSALALCIAALKAREAGND